MNLIVLDTSSEHLILGVYVRQQLFSLDEPVGQKHAECILPSLAVLLERAGATLADINTIAFSSGPGGFTGLRIGCGIAQGLAVAHGLTLMPIPTLPPSNSSRTRGANPKLRARRWTRSSSPAMPRCGW